MFPHWLHTISVISVALGFLCAAFVLVHEIRHPQKMWIMNVVWPLSALYASALALWAYVAIGSSMLRDQHKGHGQKASPKATPTWKQITISDTHCGAGCALGDIIGETWVFAAGWKLWGEKLYADYIVTFALAWAFGIAFQYFNIKPMMQLSPSKALLKSIQADTLSIVFFQIGMYGWMAIIYFVLFPHPHLQPNSATFWFMMQIGMLLGFVTSYPVNRWLLLRGIKHAMA